MTTDQAKLLLQKHSEGGGFEWNSRELDVITAAILEAANGAEQDRRDAKHWRDSIVLVPKGGFLIEIRHRTHADELLANRKLLLWEEHTHMTEAFRRLLWEIDAAIAAKPSQP